NQPNFYTKLLEQFTTNCLRFMCKDEMTVKPMYWVDYQKSVMKPADEKYAPVPLEAPVEWNLPDKDIKLTRDAETYYCDLPTQRCLVVAQEKSGIDEIWTHPFMSLRDIHTYLDIQGVDTLVPLKSFRPEFQIRPNALIRTYHIGDLTLKEIITAKIEGPTVVVHYQWNGSGLNNIVCDFKSNFRYMWPYDDKALGNVDYEWSNELNAFLATDENKEFCSLVGANIKGNMLLTGQFDGFDYSKGKSPKGISTDKFQVASSVSYPVSGKNALDLFMIASNKGMNEIQKEYASAMTDPFDVYAKSASYYDDYLSNTLSVSTPDSVFNEGYNWAVLSSAQFLVNTPGVGSSLMAGYSSSRRGWGGGQAISGRPGYAWYFGRDAVWSGLAFNGLGDFETVRKVLETMIRYQQVDGKIYHELTSSGSVHFDASDATPLFVNLMAEYLRRSGDLDFVRKNMPAVHKAMAYCYSTDTDGDHLIEISNVGHGWLEGGELYGSQTEFYLVGLWNQALLDAAYLSGVLGQTKEAGNYLKDAGIVNKLINNDFWNPDGYYNFGKKADGSYTKELISLTTVPVYLGVTDSAKSLTTIKHFSTAEYSADWGVRMINDDYSQFSPTAYHMGSIWPLFTGWTSLAEYKTGRYNQGYEHMMSNLFNYTYFSLGRVPEVINGLVYKTSGITMHQCWSETMVIQPVVEGMLGFSSDALNHTMTLAPRFPFDWNSCTVERLRIGHANVGFSMNKVKGKTDYIFTSNSPVKMDFKPAFAPGTLINSIKVNGTSAPFKTEAGSEYITVETPVSLNGEVSLEITYKEGVSALPSVVYPKLDSLSSGFRILEQSLKGKVLTVTVEGYPGKAHSFELYLPEGYQKAENITGIKKVKDNVYLTTVLFEKTDSKYTTKTIKVYIK
ncbi:MAG: GH116 family glycosyl hydrolase, partial [Bacteroidota bacterium]|nr:GH116 family glycosyl hydrolase [Bacteroidota bacterium]